jgi:hypothetical protein
LIEVKVGQRLGIQPRGLGATDVFEDGKQGLLLPGDGEADNGGQLLDRCLFTDGYAV